MKYPQEELGEFESVLQRWTKSKYPFRIYHNSIYKSVLLNNNTRGTIRFANEIFEHKRMIFWEDKLIGQKTRVRKCHSSKIDKTPSIQ